MKRYMPVFVAVAIITLLAIAFLLIKIFDVDSTVLSISLRKHVVVHDASELVNALASNTTIRLMPGKYDLMKVKVNNPNFCFGEIKNIKNLVLENIDQSEVAFETTHYQRTAAIFSNCQGLTLRNIRFGGVLKGSIERDALYTKDSSKIVIENCTFIGSLTLERTSYITCNKIRIRESFRKIIDLSNSNNLIFIDSEFKDNGQSTINTDECKEVLFRNCIVLGSESSIGFNDKNYLAVLTDEDTIPGELSRYCSVYVPRIVDWVSNVTLENTWLSNKKDYVFHQQLIEELKVVFGKQLIGGNLVREYVENAPTTLEILIEAGSSAAKLRYVTVLGKISLLKEIRSTLVKDSGIKDVSIKMKQNENNLITADISLDGLLQYFKDSTPQNFEKQGRLVIDSEETNPGSFYNRSGVYLSGKQARKVLSELIKMKENVTLENYENGPEFQRFIFLGTFKDRERVYHYFRLEQKLPLLGDFIHYSHFAMIKINALNGEVFLQEPLLGMRAVLKPDPGLQSFIIATLRDSRFEYQDINAGKIEEDISIMLLFRDGDSWVFKIQLFSEEGNNYYLLATIKKEKDEWVIIDQKVCAVESIY